MEISLRTGAGLIGFRHPEYKDSTDAWELYRLTEAGGKEYIESAIVKFSAREDNTDFTERKKISYPPGVAMSLLREIQNAIVQHFHEIQRVGGTNSYQQAVSGDRFGVDRLGSSMDTFTSNKVLQEVLVMGKVGVYVDRGELDEKPTLADTLKNRPYYYTYRAEDICCWNDDDSTEPNEYDTVLLREWFTVKDSVFNLSTSISHRFRLLNREEDGTITVRFYSNEGVPIDKNNKPGMVTYTLNMKLMPFHVYQLKHSLLKNIAYAEKTLANLISGDARYATTMNFPMFVEEADNRFENVYAKSGLRGKVGENTDSATNKAKEIVTNGPSYGRRYGRGLKAPAWINPSSEPLIASMKKQEDIKRTMRESLNLDLADLDTEKKDRKSTREAGMNAIALELERGERRLAQIWAAYENETPNTVITYPRNYSLKTDSERMEEAKTYDEGKAKIASRTYQKEMAKIAAGIRLRGKISGETLDKIYDEIDEAKTMTCDADEIQKDLEGALVSTKTASTARGYAPDEHVQAAVDHAERIARIQQAQSRNLDARGVDDLSTDPKGAKKEKEISKLDPSGLPDPQKERGEGK